jgi:hypothetical protein
MEAVFAQHMLRRWAAGLEGRAAVHRNRTVAGVPVSALVRRPKGAWLALCYVSKALDEKRWRDQHAALEGAGIAGTWIFPPRDEYLREPHPNPDSTSTGADALAVDTPLYKAMRQDGSWPLIFNIEREEVINLIVPRQKLAEQLHIAPPPFKEGVLHVRISRLDDCSLCNHGVVTPSVKAGDLWASRKGYLEDSPRRSSSPGQRVGGQQLPLLDRTAEAA